MTAGGPALRRVVDPPPGAAEALGDLWITVTEAGGAVDFVPGWDPGEIRDLAAATIAAVAAGTTRMIVAGDPAAPDGTVFLAPGSGIAAHRADVQRLMVRPELQGNGLGGALLEAAVADARELGFTMLTLGARGGTPLPHFYADRGFTEYGRLGGGVRLSADDDRDVHLFVRYL
ncbi:GNAT family N-acetyltransferase [Pseudonocardia phyllosphaerae]|uniref:GNAT family N-acetyltransferase n=1 Tax=Pseudonocardia phyllosphaerae TaxID=3390502 RepID=UPI00397CE40B